MSSVDSFIYLTLSYYQLYQECDCSEICQSQLQWFSQRVGLIFEIPNFSVMFISMLFNSIMLDMRWIKVTIALIRSFVGA